MGRDHLPVKTRRSRPAGRGPGSSGKKFSPELSGFSCRFSCTPAGAALRHCCSPGSVREGRASRKETTPDGFNNHTLLCFRRTEPDQIQLQMKAKPVPSLSPCVDSAMPQLRNQLPPLSDLNTVDSHRVSALLHIILSWELSPERSLRILARCKELILSSRPRNAKRAANHRP
jgi:hypothetical protein